MKLKKSLHKLSSGDPLRIIAIGDSYNDINMLKEAGTGILFTPPENVKNEFPELPVAYNYDELKKVIQPLLTADSI